MRHKSALLSGYSLIWQPLLIKKQNTYLVNLQSKTTLELSLRLMLQHQTTPTNVYSRWVIMKYLIICSIDICSFLSGINLLFIIHYCLKVITCSPIHIKQSISTKKNGKDLEIKSWRVFWLKIANLAQWKSVCLAGMRS